uniref:translocator protein n=1 Tax=Pristiophorus japonicus TaxID=55135 RepID=UPI00398F48E0
MFPVAWTTLYTGMGGMTAVDPCTTFLALLFLLVFHSLSGCGPFTCVTAPIWCGETEEVSHVKHLSHLACLGGSKKVGSKALVNILCLYGTVVATMVSWYPVNKMATLLLAPYLAWLTLASSLTYCIWRDNPDKKVE